MRRQTFSVHNLSITVRESIGSDIFDEDIVMVNLGNGINSHPLVRVNKFIDFVIRTERIEGDLGFEWPQAVTDQARIVLAYEHWRELPREVLREWDRQLAEVNTPPGDPALQPMDIPVGEPSAPP